MPDPFAQYAVPASGSDPFAAYTAPPPSTQPSSDSPLATTGGLALAAAAKAPDAIARAVIDFASNPNAAVQASKALRLGGELGSVGTGLAAIASGEPLVGVASLLGAQKAGWLASRIGYRTANMLQRWANPLANRLANASASLEPYTGLFSTPFAAISAEGEALGRLNDAAALAWMDQVARKKQSLQSIGSGQ